MVTLCTTVLNIQKVYVVHKVYLCVLFGSKNKQRLFPKKALAGDEVYLPLGTNPCLHIK